MRYKLHEVQVGRANFDSEFVVVNTLAKWKKVGAK